jgi:putative tryptophan/tyrosine transport system substrate-binding protein
MNRRAFITLLGGTAAAWPLAARAQQRIPRVGFLFAGTPSVWSKEVAAFAQRLGELGWIEGRTVAIEYRWVESRERYGVGDPTQFFVTDVAAPSASPPRRLSSLS